MLRVGLWEFARQAHRVALGFWIRGRGLLLGRTGLQPAILSNPACDANVDTRTLPRPARSSWSGASAELASQAEKRYLVSTLSASGTAGFRAHCFQAEAAGKGTIVGGETITGIGQEAGRRSGGLAVDNLGALHRAF